MIRRLTLILLLLAAVCFPSRADAAADSLRRELLSVADTASAPALFRISEMFERGLSGIEPDYSLAMKLLRRAAKAEYPPALNLLGYKSIIGEGIPADTLGGLRYIERAAELGDPRSFNNLGFLYLTGKILPPDTVKAVKWLRRSADAGAPSAMATLGDLYAERKMNVSDSLSVVVADSLYRRAIRLGMGDAQLKLLELRINDYNQLPPDSALNLGLDFYLHNGPYVAFRLFMRAAEGGIARAEALLGDAYSLGRGVSYDHARSLRHFYTAAAAGDPSAQFVIAELLDVFPDALAEIPLEHLPPGTEIVADPTYWYEKAAEQGITTAEQANDRLLYGK